MNYNKQSYRLILQQAINQGFEFVDFFTVNLDEDKRKQIILRHDIDYSISLAYEMAEIDAEYKIKSTFALLLASPLYNPFTSTNIKIINEINQLGHNIALHHYVVQGQSEWEIAVNIIKEMQVMRVYFPYIQPVFVWHNLPPNNLQGDIEVSDIVNADSANFVERMYYISDSVLRNKPEKFIDALDRHKYLYMLLHPIIWMSEKDSMVSMMSHVLTKIIRECDKEFAFNGAWKASFPEGIPQNALSRLLRGQPKVK